MPGDVRRAFGNEGEETACQYLTAKGLVCRERNYRLRGGEIDLVMEDGDFLVFVEVKRRRSLDYGAPEEAVTAAKIRRMTKTALTYVVQKKLTDRMMRFDVVSIDASGVHHIPNAFEAAGNFFY